MHAREGSLWNPSVYGPGATWSLDNPDAAIKVSSIYDRKRGTFQAGMRPVSCTVWRSTPHWWYGGVNAYPTGLDGPGWFNRSARSGCDIGSFPANGLLFSPPSACMCMPYLHGAMAFHSEQPERPMADADRLQRAPQRLLPARMLRPVGPNGSATRPAPPGCMRSYRPR